MVTKAEIIELLKTNNRAVARALVVLNERQTADEQASENTRYLNGRGFRPCHARMGSSMAKFYCRNGYLSDKQIAYWRTAQKDGKMRIEIYAGQLLEIAQAKAQAAKMMEPKQTVCMSEDVGNLMEERLVLEEQLSAYQEGAMGEGAEQDKAIAALIARINEINCMIDIAYKNKHAAQEARAEARALASKLLRETA